jgi:biopolymer transport protein ExbD
MSENPTELDLLFREQPDEGHHGEEGEEEVHRPKRRGHMIDEKSHSELNLTAMMDMMTILVVFLLKNYASTPENITVSDTLAPPRSSAKVPMDVAVTIVVTKDQLLVDNVAVAQVDLVKGEVVGDTAATKNAPIASLADLLDKKVADMKRLEQMGGAPFEGKILIVADEKTPYAMLMRVLYTAGLAQFSQYKLIVRSKAGNQTMHTPGEH